MHARSAQRSTRRLGRGRAARRVPRRARWLLASPAAAQQAPQWSMFEDHAYLVRSGPARARADARRDQGARRRHAADRGQVERGRARARGRKTARVRRDRPGRLSGLRALRRPRSQRAIAKGFRVMITLAPDAPDWATARRARRQLQGQLDRVRRASRARSARRYSGAFGGLPAVDVLVDLERAQPHLLHQAALRRRRASTGGMVERGAAGAARDRRRRARRSSSASWRRSAPRPR